METTLTRKRGATLFWVAFLTLLGLLLRLWKLDHGLPHVHYTDEAIDVYYSLNMGGGDLNPHHFRTPNLYHYLLLFLDVVYILGGLVVGIFKVPGDAWKLYLADPTVFYFIGRIATAVLGTLTLPLTYFVGKKVFNERVGLLGTFFLTFAFLHVQWSQLAYSDVPFTFFVILAFLFSFLAFEQGKLLYFTAAGLAGGLSMSTKYQGLVTLLWGPLASFLRARQNGERFLPSLWGRGTLLFLGLFGLGFTVGTPYWILDFKKFSAQSLWALSHLKTGGTGQLGYEGDWNWFYYLQGVLVYGLGIPLEVAGILGMILFMFRGRAQGFFFASFPLAFYFVIGLAKIRVAKYAMPLFPFLSLAAAYFTVSCISNFVKKDLRWQRGVLALTSLLLILPSFLSSMRYLYLRTFPDTREQAIAWVQKELPPQSKVLQSTYLFIPNLPSGPEVKPLDPTLVDTRVNHRPSLKSLADYRAEGFQYLVLDEWHMGLALVEAARVPERRNIFERYQKFEEKLRESAQLIASFSPYREENVAFDMENVELASRSLWKMKSTGPRVWIYKL